MRFWHMRSSIRHFSKKNLRTNLKFNPSLNSVGVTQLMALAE